jgi:hypothetical protein
MGDCDRRHASLDLTGEDFRALLACVTALGGAGGRCRSVWAGVRASAVIDPPGGVPSRDRGVLLT